MCLRGHSPNDMSWLQRVIHTSSKVHSDTTVAARTFEICFLSTGGGSIGTESEELAGSPKLTLSSGLVGRNDCRQMRSAEISGGSPEEKADGGLRR